ncbi:50S ribosomal protein L10 [Halorutilales archaeon Cl-col2-1]
MSTTETETQSEALTEEVPEWKKQEVEEFKKLLDEYTAVGVVNVEGIGSKQFQQVRENLHGSAKVRVGRNTLMRRALSEKGLDDLVEYVSGQSGLLLTDSNPFTLYKKIEESKSPAPLKEGQVAPHDIVVPEGDTGMDPGPFVGDLQQAGVNARIEEGSIKVIEDSVVTEEGEEASAQVAEVLQKMEIFPVEVGVDLRAVIDIEGGTVFEPDTLDIDEEEYVSDLESAAAGAFNLGVNAGIANETTVRPMLSKAGGEARSLGVEAEITEPGVIEDLVAQADSSLRGVASEVDDDALPEELQGVEADAPEPQAQEESESEEAETEDEEEQEAEPEEDEDDEDVSEGMGNLF